MLTHYGNFLPKLTPFSITSRWLLATDGGGGAAEGFEVATWVDPDQAWRAAKVVIGPTGCWKNAFGPLKPFDRNAYTL